MPWELEREIVNAGYRHLAKKAHPDHNGSAADMVRLNEARARLNLVCSHGLDILFPQDGTTAPQAKPTQPSSTIFPPPPSSFYRPRYAEQTERSPELLQYLYQQIASDPFGEAVLKFAERWLRKGNKPRKGAASRRSR